jgi:hypothetical protein
LSRRFGLAVPLAVLEWDVNDIFQVRRWSKGGRGVFVNIPTGSDTIMEILGLKSGSMLFARGNGFGLISPDAKVIQLKGLGGIDFSSDEPGSLRVSADGRIVHVEYPLNGHCRAFQNRRE